MTKHAIEGLTKAMAVKLACNNIRVNSVCPTFVETPLAAGFFEDEKFKKDVLEQIPLGRIGTVEEVVAAVLFLTSPKASLITGSGLLVDGGRTGK
jgi:NAD(P)-dependent dehydrogenase (short-subunit alcohol dehydrogenase family)